MKRKMLSAMFAVTLMIGCMTTTAFAEGNGSLDQVINKNQTTVTQPVTNTQGTDTKTQTTTDTKTNTPETNVTSGSNQSSKNSDFTNGLTEAGDLSANVEGASKVTAGLKKAVSFVVQILSYGITILLALRVLLDLAFIGLPFLRKWLGNGYMGNAQAGAGGAPQQGGMPGMGGMGGMGGGMGGMGMGGMHGGRYGGGMGGMGMGGMQGGMGGMQGGQQQQSMGRIQWVSNAALNAVAGETTVGPDGQAVSPFRLYVKDMMIILIITPVLITLAVTGVLTGLGFSIGSMLVDGIRSLKGMM